LALIADIPASAGTCSLVCFFPSLGRCTVGPDGLIYITCENSAVVAVIDRATNKVVDAIDSGSTNGHRLIIAPDGARLYRRHLKSPPQDQFSGRHGL
jgi:hypothetical protein